MQQIRELVAIWNGRLVGPIGSIRSGSAEISRCADELEAALTPVDTRIQELEAALAETHRAWNTENERRHDAEDQLHALQTALPQRPEPRHRRSCECAEPDPVMQADRKFYCYRCSFETGARPACLEPEMSQGPEPRWQDIALTVVAQCEHAKSPYPADINWSRGFGCAMTMALGWIIGAFALTDEQVDAACAAPPAPPETEK